MSDLNKLSDPVMEKQLSAEELLEEQIPGEEAISEEGVDANILDELFEEDLFEYDETTNGIIDYFFEETPADPPTYDNTLNAEDAKLYEELTEDEQYLLCEVAKHKILVVGAGGIGCELLKDLVLIGFSDIEVIDLDTIDVSNLNRQFLFRRCHVSQPKAIVARESALQFNPDVKIVAYHDSVFSERFGVSYFEKFKFVLNALDNRSARNHVNKLCITARVPLIETGTSGYHGQVEVIIKGLSQCYECEPKPPQKTYPGCTIRNTPSEPVHCIVWAKHLFNQLFGEEDADNEVSPDSSDPELYEGSEATSAANAPDAGDSSTRNIQDPESSSTVAGQNSKESVTEDAQNAESSSADAAPNADDTQEPKAKRLRLEEPAVPSTSVSIFDEEPVYSDVPESTASGNTTNAIQNELESPESPDIPEDSSSVPIRPPKRVYTDPALRRVRSRGTFTTYIVRTTIIEKIYAYSPEFPDTRSRPADLKRIRYSTKVLSSSREPVIVSQSPESPDEDSEPEDLTPIKEIFLPRDSDGPPPSEYIYKRREDRSKRRPSNLNKSTPVRDNEIPSTSSTSNDGNVRRTSTRQWAREGGFLPELLHKKFFVDDINYLLSMKTLWKTRRPPTPSDMIISELPDDVDAEYKGLDRTMKVWSWPMCTYVFATSVNVLAERWTTLDRGDYLTWDKDDDVALDFVTACANIRSYIFGIPVKSRFDVKAIAGNIIPAIATTNAIVSGIAILHSLEILNDDLAKTTTVHLRKYPNPNGELFLPEKGIIPPNPGCAVCSSLHPEAVIEIDVENTTIQEFLEIVLKNGLKMISPDVVLPTKSLIVISSEEGETDHNNSKTLVELGIVDGSILHADDFDQDYEIQIIIKHKKPTKKNPLFFKIIKYPEDCPRPIKKVDKDSRDEPIPGCSKDLIDSDLKSVPSTVGSNTDALATSSYESDDEACCIIDDDCLLVDNDAPELSKSDENLMDTDEPSKTNGKSKDPTKIKGTKHKLDDESPTIATKKLKSDDTSTN